MKDELDYNRTTHKKKIRACIILIPFTSNSTNNNNVNKVQSDFIYRLR